MKIFRNERYTVVAVCDAELLGKEYREGSKKIEVRKEFFGGRSLNVKEALRSVSEADIANLMGKNVVKAAVEAGLVHPSATIEICGILHAQIVKL